MWPFKFKPAPPPFTIDMDAVRILAGRWGITWPLEILIAEPPIPACGSCTTDYVARFHIIHVSPTTYFDPERVIRHELAHCVDAERRCTEIGDPHVASREMGMEYLLYGYQFSPCEIYARSREAENLEIKLTDGWTPTKPT